MKKLLAVLIFTVLTVSAMAADLPKPIAARYKSLMVALDKLDAKAFKGYFTADFVNVDPKGKSVKLAPFLKDINGLFESGKSAKTVEKTLDVKMDGEKVAVNCDVLMTMIAKDGSTLILHEVCTDYWKQVKGQWYIYKTVDTVFDMKSGETKGAKPATGKKK